MVNEKLAKEICGLVLAVNALLETPNNIGPAEAESLRMKSDSAQKALEEEYAKDAAEKAEAPITHGLHLDSKLYVPVLSSFEDISSISSVSFSRSITTSPESPLPEKSAFDSEVCIVK